MTIPDSVRQVLSVAAPALLSAFLGPLGGVAATIATAALNAWLPASSVSAPGAPQPAVAGTATPGQVVQAVQQNADDPRFLLALRQAELDLERYQQDLGFRFADLEQKDRQGAREMVRDTGLARPQFLFGMGVVVLSMLMLFAVVAGCVLALTGRLSIDPAATNIAIAAFGLLGTVVGVFQAVSAQILAFYFGSSSGSKDKTDQMTETMRDMGAALGDAAKAAPAALPTPSPPVVVLPPAAVPAAPAAPASVDWQQGPFGGVRWRMDDEGYVVVEGEAKPGRTVGEPVTARRIWRDYGHIIAESCGRNGVPLELAVACIATESRGHAQAMLTEPDGRQSLGLMQVLTGTASEVMGRTVEPRELLDPAIGIEAGVRYLAKQRPVTKFAPPLAAAAYNAGGLYQPRQQDANRWKLRSTGDHIDRLCLYFNDCVFVAKQDGWAGREAGQPPKPPSEPVLAQ